jgi:hypothetical protein
VVELLLQIQALRDEPDRQGTLKHAD